MNGAFSCSICGEPSTRICVYCTKDACDNHLCAKCRQCSDCCECTVPLDEEAGDMGVESRSAAENHERPVEA